MKGSGVVFTHGEGIGTPHVRPKGRQPLIECANMTLIFMFPFMFFISFIPFLYFFFWFSIVRILGLALMGFFCACDVDLVGLCLCG